MAKKRTRKKSRSKRKFAGKGRYCVTITRPASSRSGGKKRGGLRFSTICYDSKAKAIEGIERRTGENKKFYTAMIHPRGRGR